MIRGIGTSKGIGMGHALVMEGVDLTIPDKQIQDTEAEKKRFWEAKKTFIAQTQTTIEQLTLRLENDEKTAHVLKNQIYLVNDMELNQEVEKRIDSKKLCAEAAIDETCTLYIKLFSEMQNETMNTRVADIVDMRNGLLHLLLDVAHIDLTSLAPGTILIAKELHPSVTARMDTAHIAGIVSEKGGETSHASILARALEIPAVLHITNCTDNINNGVFVIVDGEYGEVFINPIPKTIEIYEKKREAYQKKVRELKKYLDKETMTSDGRRVALVSNIGNDKEARKAMEAGAEGIGLFRTEFLFMNQTSMPTEQEQFEIYRRVAVLCDKKPVTIRTLDIGGDKDIPYLGLTKESNPFLGYRAIRYCLGRVDVFQVQLRAILRASAFGHIRIMIPLVTSLGEINSVKQMIHTIGKDLERQGIAYDDSIEVGVMIETPAAAVLADVLAREADFFSIGTNDLTQYMLAVDRGNENVAYLYSVFHPALLRCIQRIIACAKEEGIEIGMCGEAAGDPKMIPLLLAFGLDEFSVTSSKVLETRKNIASWTIERAKSIAATVMKMENEKEITAYLEENLMTQA